MVKLLYSVLKIASCSIGNQSKYDACIEFDLARLLPLMVILQSPEGWKITIAPPAHDDSVLEKVINKVIDEHLVLLLTVYN